MVHYETLRSKNMNPKIIRVIMTYKVEINYETSDIGNSIHKVTSQNYWKTVYSRERRAHKKLMWKILRNGCKPAKMRCTHRKNKAKQKLGINHL